MAQRHRSNDDSRDSEKILGSKGAISQQGRSGDTLQRDIASEDELKRATERPAGKTRVTKQKERGEDDA